MKRTLISTMIVLAPLTAVAAQQAPQPASAPGTVITSAIRAFGTQYAAWLTTAFDSIPAAKYNYKPTPAQMSVGQVAAHLEDANYSICSRMSGIPHVMTAKDSMADTIKMNWPKDTLVARLKASFTFCKGAWDGLTECEAHGLGAGVRSGAADRARAAGGRLRDGSRGSLQPDRELHATERHAAAVVVSATKDVSRAASRGGDGAIPFPPRHIIARDRP